MKQDRDNADDSDNTGRYRGFLLASFFLLFFFLVVSFSTECNNRLWVGQDVTNACGKKRGTGEQHIRLLFLLFFFSSFLLFILLPDCLLFHEVSFDW